MFIDKNVHIEDAGSYSMIAFNAASEVSTKMRIVVLGRPEPIEKVEIVKINADFATLNWNIPKDTGRADSYTVEKRDDDLCKVLSRSSTLSLILLTVAATTSE